VVVKELNNDIFYAEIVLDMDEQEIRIDARPSDAIALAVRAEVPIYVTEQVMDDAGRIPDADISPGILFGAPADERETSEEIEEEDLGAFADFIEGLDLDDLNTD